MLNDDKMNNRDHGVIVWLGDRGYGFIRPDQSERDVFVHRSECELPASEELRIGDRITNRSRLASRQRGENMRTRVRLVNGDGS